MIRPATAGDATQIALIHVRSWQEAYRGLVPQDYLDHLDPADRVARWRRHIQGTDWSRSGVLVAPAGDEPAGATTPAHAELAGFVSYGPSRDADADPAVIGEVSTIYVLAEAWGRGLGRRLMSGAVEHLTSAGYSQATLWVLPANARARRFYAAAGWSEDAAVQEDSSLGFPLTEVRYRRPLP
jgi:ribosomal protein S18 acetylase RimI-like enzyme